MSNLLTSKARHHHTHQPAARHFLGWALERAADLDRHSARGLLADITTAPTLKRQTAFAILAMHRSDEITTCLERLPGDQHHLGDALQIRTARALLKAAFGAPVPMGYLRALTRIGRDPLVKPHLYRRLFEIFTYPVEARKAHVLRYCGSLHSSQIEAVDVLDPLLLDPEIVAGLLGIGSANHLNSLFHFVKSICSTVTDREIAVSFRVGSVPV